MSSSFLLGSCRRFTLDDIHIATSNFDESKVIGKGGFGKVYHGVLYDGSRNLDVAVKRLDISSNQGGREFSTEIEMLSKFRHCNLVTLVGFCDEFPHMILVYEFMAQGSLADHLFKNSAFSPPLPWERRLRICMDAAHGLNYLHTGTGLMYKVIHRDVKSANILLDENWAAKISDMGLATMGPVGQERSEIITEAVKGTRGYIDPMYCNTRKLTRKADVYSFGVVLFEVLTGSRAWAGGLIPDQTSLDHWVQKHIKEGNVFQVVDARIKGEVSPKCLEVFVEIARRCLHSDPKKRPTMSEVVVKLESALAHQTGTNPSTTISDGATMGHFGTTTNGAYKNVNQVPISIEGLESTGRDFVNEYSSFFDLFRRSSKKKGNKSK